MQCCSWLFRLYQEKAAEHVLFVTSVRHYLRFSSILIAVKGVKNKFKKYEWTWSLKQAVTMKFLVPNYTVLQYGKRETGSIGSMNVPKRGWSIRGARADHIHPFACMNNQQTSDSSFASRYDTITSRRTTQARASKASTLNPLTGGQRNDNRKRIREGAGENEGKWEIEYMSIG